MHEFLTLPTGRWLEFTDESAEDASRIGNLSQTAVGHVFARDRAGGGSNRYFVFRSEDKPERFEVAVGVRHGAIEPQPPLPHVTGHGNRDPFPALASEIAALGHELGVELGPEHYPYRRPAPTTRAEDSSPGM